MRLGEFILANVEPILAEWETFARRIWPEGEAGDVATLRDHAAEILRATAMDMSAAQSEGERADKATGGGGRDGADSRRLDGASDLHGVGRVESGFKLKEVVSEYRALRASVVRLWRANCPDPGAADVDDLTRFHESMDQSLTKAVNSYTERVDRSRQLFLAILGHDLRSPLNAMTMSAETIRYGGQTDPESAEAAARIVASARAMAQMISDLLDFTGSGLGGAMRLSPAPTDLGDVCRAVVDETKAGHPTCTIAYDPTAGGDLTGEWDADRLRQVVSNLLGNAVQHGADPCRIGLTVDGTAADGVTLVVHNEGVPIPDAALTTIFDPLVRLASPDLQRRRRPGSIGLGLYIAREVIKAHGGTIDVTSSADAGTTFTARLPRRPPR